MLSKNKLSKLELTEEENGLDLDCSWRGLSDASV